MLAKFNTGELITTASTNSSRPLIEFVDVAKIFKSEAGVFPALRGVNLTIQAGEFVSVVGKSGSGKSTLINMLTGIDRPSRGEIYVAGTPVHTLNESQIARWRGEKLGVVFQFFQLLPTLTLLENIRLPMDFCDIFPRPERNDRAMALLDLVDLSGEAGKTPARLSGGQQQRAAIARSLANDPPIIATDEPTGNLDSATANQVIELFERLVGQGKTIIMVTHDPDLALRAARVISIADGQIISETRPEKHL
ncbi:MAG: ABC transporter ATP-binding protein [Anaerolineaceae bacterium]|nr:ABC transporter ATP-binding protein [Anaerolineaceae bacterium]